MRAQVCIGRAIVDWKRAAALLYGDWGTSKAYVIGLAFVAAGFSSLPIVLGSLRRDRPGRHQLHRYLSSLSRWRRRLLMRRAHRDVCWRWSERFLLVADLTVTAALSGWSALSYITSGAEGIVWIKFLRDHIALTTIGVLLVMGLINCFGPKHSGSLAVALALPTVSGGNRSDRHGAPHLTTRFLRAAARRVSARCGCNSSASSWRCPVRSRSRISPA